jgi:hypothetical protein
MAARRSYVGRCRRGSMAVEMIVVVPLFLLLWQIANIVHAVNVGAARASEETRSCSWRHALRGCEAVPSGCQIAHDGRLAGPELEGASGGAFLTIGRILPFLHSTMNDKHGSLVEAYRFTRVRNPLWSDIPIRAGHVVMCNTPTLEFTEAEVVRRTCTTMTGGSWCP